MGERNILIAFLLAGMLIFGCVGGGPTPPTGVTAKAVAGGIEVSWGPSSSANVIGYNIYRSTAAGDLGTKLNAALVSANKYTDTNVEDGITYYYTVRSVDSSGNEEKNTNQASATAKTAAPSGLQLTINDGAQYTGSAQVTLKLSATNAYQCRFSSDGSSWGEWEAYSATKSWALPSGDGHKDVFAECKDSVGNLGAPATSSIYLDTVPPGITISSPESGGQYSETFDLIFTVTDPISSTVTCTGKLDGSDIAIGVVDVGKQDKISVEANPGTHTITLDCTDNVNSAQKSVTFTVADQPEVSIHIESGSGYVNTRNVKIDITAANANQCRFSNDGTVNWGQWFTYAIPMSVSWTLSSGDGNKYVFAECKNAQGVVSDPASDSVYLDTSHGKRISIQINDGAQVTNSRNVRLGLYCYAADECRYSNDGDSWSSWSDYTTSRHWELSGGEGKKYVYYNCRDVQDNDLGQAQASITYRSQPQPDVPTNLKVMINHGASHTTSPNVGLQLYAQNANDCRYRNDNGDWTGWYVYGTSRDWTLSDGDGRKTVYYQCRNDYGTANAVSASIYLDSGPPPPVTNLVATIRGSSVYLRWSRPSTSIVSYNIYRSTHSLGMFSKIASTSSIGYTDSNVMAGEGYSYSVRGVDSAGNEAPDSNIVSVDIPGGTAGGDVDEHGCVGSAGYTWCEPKQKCLRTWEEPCEEGVVPENGEPLVQ